ncbi:hypothetical protein MASR2M41_14990 [Flammeovirgaceae bacterium]
MINKFKLVYFLLTLSIILTVLSGIITYYNGLQNKEVVNAIIHAYNVIHQSEKTVSALRDMETGQRGFSISNDSSYLETYLVGKANIKFYLDTLTSLVGDDPRQLLLLENHIKPSAALKEAITDTTISLFKNHGLQSAIHIISNKEGKAVMDTIRLLMADVAQLEGSLLNTRTLRWNNIKYWEDAIRFSSFGLIGLTSFIALISLKRKNEQNRNLLNSLKGMNEDLENKVVQRTKELQSERDKITKLNEELKALNQEKDHFIGVASHDLKSPIIGIQRMVEVIRLQRENPIKTLEYISYIDESCQSLQRLITNLLDINKIEQGLFVIEKETIEIKPFIAKLLKPFETLAELKKIKIEVACEIEKANSDEDVLKRILDNLVSNAIKFSRPNSKIVLKLSEGDGKLIVEIKDQGIGIRDDELALVFRKFSKLSNKPTGGEGSTGLGLAIAKELVEQLEGEISIASEQNVGTTVTLTFSNG